MRLFTSCLYLFFWLNGWCISSVWAQEPQRELNAIRKEIRSLQQDITQKKNAHEAAQKAIAETEQILRNTKRELSTLEKQRLQSLSKLQLLQKQLASTQIRLNETKMQVGKILTSQYQRGQHDALLMLLNDSNPNQRSRDIVYYRYISQAQQSVVKKLRQQQIKLNELHTQMEQEVTRLSALTGKKCTEKQKIEQDKSVKQSESMQLSQQIKSQQQKLIELKANEQRLNQILADIQRKNENKRKALETQRQIKKEAAKRENARRKQIAQEAKKAGHPIPQEALKQVEVETADTNTDIKTNQQFQQAQGRMNFPVSGRISGNYGGKREEGSTWKGIFISAPVGQPVKAIANGEVVYAGNLRGYGNIVIISHGKDYMTVYAGLSNISRNEGTVSAGQKIGLSGRLDTDKTGLYFEIRYKGVTINPDKWLR